MKHSLSSRRSLVGFFAGLILLPCAACLAGQYTNFDVAIYIPIGVVQNFGNEQTLSNQWSIINRQLKVDKVYIEVQRDRNLATDDLLERVKTFFLQHGVKVAGGMALSDGSIGGQFKSFCYTDPKDREFIKSAAELGARHFDELIQDDFFFVTTKYESDIAAKGDRSWTQFRLDLMDDAAENLIIKPARTVNPRIKLVIKFPNWYEHFQGLGFDLEKEPKLFDGIYTGTETRDPEITDQNLQQYESYQIIRYFENIAPGRNGGGWVDTFSIRYVDRYAEQLWNTVFAKAREMTLFNWAALMQPIRPGDRGAWQDLQTSFNYSAMLESYKTVAPAGSGPTMARAAGYALEQADSFLGKLGQPIGVKSYKPFHSTGEDFLHNWLGNLGIPIDLQPEFPTNANLVLLTECAKFDPAIVAKIKGQLTAGKSVVVTSGLFRALQGRGIEDIVEARCTERKILAREYWTGYGAGNGAVVSGEANSDILFPELDFLTNDAWSLVRAQAGGRGYPLLFMDRYSKGVLYVWTIPDNFNDLYRLPTQVTTTIKNFVMEGFPIRVDGPNHVALFAYDNNTCIVENCQHAAADATVSLLGDFTKLRNLVTGEVYTRQLEENNFASGRRGGAGPGVERRNRFHLQLPPHSYAVLAAEQ